MISLFVLLAASGISERDANAAVMYMQSYATPAIFDTCKNVMPARAADFDAALADWQKANKHTVSRGEKVSRRHAGGTDLDAMLSVERDSMVSELKALSADDQIERCEHALEVTRSES
jgi:hypothetical protein